MNATVMTTGPGRDHRDGHRIQELLLGQPAELLDDALVQKRDDRQAAAEDEGPGLREEEENLDENTRDRRCPTPTHHARAPRSGDRRPAAPSAIASSARATRPGAHEAAPPGRPG